MMTLNRIEVFSELSDRLLEWSPIFCRDERGFSFVLEEIWVVRLGLKGIDEKVLFFVLEEIEC